MSIVEMSVSGGAMILVTALLRLAAGDRLPRRGYVALWAAAIIRLLVPFRIASPVSFYGLLSQMAIKVETPGAAAVEKTPTGSPIWTVIWLAGMTAAGIAFAVSYIRCIRAFRTSTPLGNKFINDWLTDNTHWRRVRVRALPGLRTPLTYGLLRPVILLPEEADGWDAERLGMVLCHEYIHIRRWDGALKKLAILALCVHWWNPAAWLMAALLDRDIELACDGAVVDRFGPECRAQYARLLIELKAPNHSAGLVTGFGKNVTEKRVRDVMGHRRATKLAAVLSAALAVSVVAFFATSANPKTAETAPPADETGVNGAEALPGQTEQGSGLTVEGAGTAHFPITGNGGTKPADPGHPAKIDPANMSVSLFVVDAESGEAHGISIGGSEKTGAEGYKLYVGGCLE